MEYIPERLIEAIRERMGKEPDGFALIRGSDQYKKIRGTVYFYQQQDGVLVLADIRHLPVSKEGGTFFGFHIHEKGHCDGETAEPFSHGGGHYNPEDLPHPFHAGDLPPILGTEKGNAFSLFLTDRFQLKDVYQRSVMIHREPDDFTGQPAGNAGIRIACGVIMKW